MPRVVLVEKPDLKNIFQRYGIMRGYYDWPLKYSEDRWKEATDALISRTDEKDSPRDDEINIEDLPQLLADAKNILRSFLVTSSDIPIDEERFSDTLKKRNALRRLFTYAKLQKIINEKSLTHVRLPKKRLLIKDKVAKKYLTGKPAMDILDGMVKIFAVDIKPPRVQINFESPREKIELDEKTKELNKRLGLGEEDYELRERYEPIVFPQFIRNTGMPFNKDALRELEILVNEAPFDIGFDNIFSDENGNAIIIDTEFKGESAEESVAKLKARYK